MVGCALYHLCRGPTHHHAWFLESVIASTTVDTGVNWNDCCKFGCVTRGACCTCHKRRQHTLQEARRGDHSLHKPFITSGCEGLPACRMRSTGSQLTGRACWLPGFAYFCSVGSIFNLKFKMAVQWFLWYYNKVAARINARRCCYHKDGRETLW